MSNHKSWCLKEAISFDQMLSAFRPITANTCKAAFNRYTVTNLHCDNYLTRLHDKNLIFLLLLDINRQIPKFFLFGLKHLFSVILQIWLLLLFLNTLSPFGLSWLSYKVYNKQHRRAGWNIPNPD